MTISDPSGTPPSENTRLRCLIALAVAALTFLVFSPALDNGFVNWDDIGNLAGNYRYRGLDWDRLKWMFTTFHLGPYQPLSWLSYALDHLVWGMDPFGYHLTNLILHSVNAALFFLLSLKLMNLAAGPFSREREPDLYISAGFAALLFSIHPLRVESVAWVTERRDVLSGLFYLLAVHLYVGSRSPGNGGASAARLHVPPLAAFLLALLSKGMAVSLPVTLILLDIYPLRRLAGGPAGWFARGSRRIWFEKIPYFVLAAVFGVAGYLGQVGAGASSAEYGPASRLAQMLFGAGFYVRKTLFPSGLSPLYGPAGGLGDARVLLAAAAVLAITAAAFAVRRRRPVFLTVWACYLAALAPVSGIVKMGAQAAADRYSYLPCLGFAVLAGAGLFSVRTARGRFRTPSAVLACLLAAGLAFLTDRQIRVWHDSETLWNHALSLDPGLDIAHFTLGQALAERGNFEEAVRHYQEAVRLNPNAYDACNNLGIISFRRGKHAEAARYYLEALRLKPDYPEAYSNLGQVLAAQGKPGEAIESYRKALAIDPELQDARYGLGALLAGQGKTEEAAVQYKAALNINPWFAEAHNGLGVILAGRGDLRGAMGHYLEALKIKPELPGLHNDLGVLLSLMGEFGEAERQYREALRLKPDDAEVYNNLGTAAFRQKKFSEAAGYYRKALKFDPERSEYRVNLGFALSAQKRSGGKAGPER